MYRNTLIWSDQGVMLCQGLVMEEGYRLSDGRLGIRFAAALLFAVLLCFPPVASAQESQCFDFVATAFLMMLNRISAAR